MKKIVLSAILLMAVVSAGQAAVVTPQRSAAVAATFFAKSAATKGIAPAAMQLLASYPVKDAAQDEAPAFYVYGQSNGGFVMVAGDDAARPILAYSERDIFPSDDQMPEGMRTLLQWYALEIGYARSRGWEPDASTRQLWEDPAAAVQSSTPVLLQTPTWNQWKPFNDMCPKVSGQECPCGCVATAMGIIMRYHKWPDAGVGTLPGYEFGWNGFNYMHSIPDQKLGHSYDWDAMPMSYSGSYSPYAGQQVAQLMFDLGVMSNMSYAPEGSGAADNSALYLAKYFKYDKQIRYYSRDGFINDERWESYIRNEIDAGRPVFYCGYSGGGGHAFVLDGYRDRYFHINYGWGGNSDNYYTITPVEGHAGDLLQYNSWQSMVINIMPDKGGEPYIPLTLNGFASFGWDFQSDTFPVESIGLYKYIPTSDGKTELTYCLYDKALNHKETLCEPFIVGEGEVVEAPAVTCRAPSNVAHGDYLLLSRRDGLGGWEPLAFNDRRSYCQFDRETPLADMISIGHTYGSVITGSKNYDEAVNLYLKAFKDIYWELRLKSGDVLFRSVETSYNYYRYLTHYHNGEYYFTSLSEIDSYDPERPYFQFFLPPGEYVFYFRKFDEELTIDVKL